MGDDDQPDPPDDLETHPLNPAARRRPGGYWNEDVLPVTDWESPEHRVVLPVSIQERVGLPTAVLRWSRTKRARILHLRPWEAERLDRLSELLATWEYYGVNPATPNAWEVLFRDDGRWYLAVFGPDLNGSWNVITLHPLRDRQFQVKVAAGWAVKRVKK